VWEYEWERDRVDEETERDSSSTSAPCGFDVAALGGRVELGEGGENKIGDTGELQAELESEKSSTKLS
jgi:hypothetical protein